MKIKVILFWVIYYYYFMSCTRNNINITNLYIAV